MRVGISQRRYVSFKAYTEKAQRKEALDKLDYVHINPVRRRFVASAADWCIKLEALLLGRSLDARNGPDRVNSLTCLHK